MGWLPLLWYCFSICLPSVLAHVSCYNKIPETGKLMNSRKFASHGSGDWEAKIKVFPKWHIIAASSRKEDCCRFMEEEWESNSLALASPLQVFDNTDLLWGTASCSQGPTSQQDHSGKRASAGEFWRGHIQPQHHCSDFRASLSLAISPFWFYLLDLDLCFSYYQLVGLAGKWNDTERHSCCVPIPWTQFSP